MQVLYLVDSLLHCGDFHVNIGTRVPLLGQVRKKWSIGRGRWVGAACVLAGVFGHALLQRATGVIHAAIARPPSRLFASDALSINPLEQTCHRGDFGEEEARSRHPRSTARSLVACQKSYYKPNTGGTVCRARA